MTEHQNSARAEDFRAESSLKQRLDALVQRAHLKDFYEADSLYALAQHLNESGTPCTVEQLLISFHISDQIALEKVYIFAINIANENIVCDLNGNTQWEEIIAHHTQVQERTGEHTVLDTDTYGPYLEGDALEYQSGEITKIKRELAYIDAAMRAEDISNATPTITQSRPSKRL